MPNREVEMKLVFGQSNVGGTKSSRISERELDELQRDAINSGKISKEDFDDANRMLAIGARKQVQSGRINAKKKRKEPSQPKAVRTGGYTPCASSHPPLPIIVGGKTYHVYGGSATRSEPCSSFDVFIGLDCGMQLTARRYPWNKGVEFLYPITDMQAPSKADEFTELIGWVASQVLSGKKVFVGCIGGHGRTGTVLAALVKQMTGNADATEYVRQNYCKKAVESGAQVEFLAAYFGIKKVKPTKGADAGKNFIGFNTHHQSQKSLWDDYISGSTITKITPVKHAVGSIVDPDDILPF